MESGDLSFLGWLAAVVGSFILLVMGLLPDLFTKLFMVG